MLITTQNELQSLMPTARWDRPQQLFGYIEEEESVALEPLLGVTLYQFLLTEYDRLRQTYTDITATTVRPTGKAKQDARLAHADVTERLEQIQQGKYRETYTAPEEGEKDVPAEDLKTIRLIRICQQIEFYKMLSHKAGLLTVSFNEGGGMNIVTAEGYDPADEKRMERVVKDAFMSAGRATDSLLLFLEADAKGERLFTEKWQDADAFYLHKDLLFQTARVLNEYLDIKGERMAYVQLVRDIRFCQNTYLKPRIGGKLLAAVIEYANLGGKTAENTDGDGTAEANSSFFILHSSLFDELLGYLRTALAFYVESRRTTLGPKEEKLARRDSMTDAQQAMAMACQFVEDNLDALGEAAVDTPIYNRVKEKEAQAARDAENAEKARCRQRMAQCEQSRRKLFTGFPATHRTPELK
jgi:hypothetical protein